jgi:hypothetical protein
MMPMRKCENGEKKVSKEKRWLAQEAGLEKVITFATENSRYPIAL